ncbi:MAG: PD40 domain-containing protein [Deltaproteobacteria bacterium]|nr:PD40 domain-containing protein [Deltaproteobacteria bacterium]
MVKRRALLALVAAIVAAAACYSPAFTDCELACSPAGMCPSGFECVGPVCRAVGATGTCPPATPDASGDGEMLDAPMTHPTTMWGNVSRVYSPPNGFVVEDPSLTGDERELFLMYGSGSGSGSPGTSDIVVATRPMGGAFSALFNAQGLNDLDSLVRESAPYVTTDGLTMYLASTRPGGMGGSDIWMHTRPTRASNWGEPVAVASLNTVDTEIGGSITANGRMIALSRVSANFDDEDIYIGIRAMPSGAWEMPLPEVMINSAGIDSHPHLSPDGLAIYFHSNRFTGTDFDLYEAHRSSIGAEFEPPRRLDELSTQGFEEDPWVSPDGMHIYFTRTVGGVKYIYDARR